MSATDKTPQVKAEIAALSAAIKSDIAIDKKDGTSKVEDGIFIKNAPEGLTTEIFDAVRDYRTNFVAAGALAVGQAAVEAMTSNKKIEQVSLDIGLDGKDAAHYTVDRKKISVDQIHDKGAEIVKYGVVSTSLTVNAGRNTGQLKVARAQIGALALAQLAK